MNLYLSAWSILTKKNQKKFFFIIFLFLLLSIVEIIGIASVIPFVTVIFSPDKLSELPVLNNFEGLTQKYKNILLPFFCIFFFFYISFKKYFFNHYL